MIRRIIRHRIEQTLSSGKSVLLLGPRQVGKTTLLMDIHSENPASMYLDCDEPDVRSILTDASSTKLRAYLGTQKLVIIDEAQRVKNIGLTLKLIIDKLKDIKLIVSGSSALELSSDINEPLTGRKIEILMNGISYQEMVDDHGRIAEQRLIETRLIYGMYPEVITFPDRAEILLRELTSGYLYKDVFNYQDVRKPELLHNLTEALARQIGSEVSYNELAQLLASDPSTIGRYIDLLEKSMVVFRLRSFSRNLRNELKKSRKIYFYDTGVRNAIVGDFRPMSLRSDAGHLWENYMVSERVKMNMNLGLYCNQYFWRTRQQQEIDYIEEANGAIRAYEFKYRKVKLSKFSKSFTDEYHPVSTETINTTNFHEFLSKT
ncbi:MAG: ATP-binding protein [Saprospiraceae bacterium]